MLVFKNKIEALANCRSVMVKVQKPIMEMPEATNYLCEAGFSRCIVTTSKHPNILDVSSDMRIQLSTINPSLKDFVRRRNNTTLHTGSLLGKNECILK